MTLSLENNCKVIRCRPLLGTFVEITAEHAERKIADQAIDKAFASIENIQRLMSFHDVRSEVSKLNCLASREDVFVSPQTYEVIQRAKELHEYTGGIFDIAVATELVNLELLPRHSFIECSAYGRTKDIVLRDNGSIYFSRPLNIDLGGIAKGFAVDEAIEVLKENSVTNAVVNAGGDLRCFGEREESVWVRHPTKIGELLSLPSLRDAALATSKSKSYIDGLSRKSIERYFSVSVKAENCLTADALTKVVLSSFEDAVPILNSFKAAAFILYPDSRILFYEGKS